MVVLDEAVLHRLIGSPQVMHDALVHVAEFSQRPYVVVQVVPGSNGANVGLAGAFDIAAADGMPETLRMEGVEDQTTPFDYACHPREDARHGHRSGRAAVRICPTR